jgi:hypothetical protein
MLGYIDSLGGVSFDPNNERFKDFNGEICISEHYNVEFEDFFKAINAYSSILLSKEDRFMMEILGLTLRYYEDIKLISEQDLFNLSEQEIINKIMDSNYSHVLKDILSIEKVRYANPSDDGIILLTKPKIRQASPLCRSVNYISEIDGISGDFYRELNPLGEAIELTDKPITADLSNQTVKVLSKYKR